MRDFNVNFGDFNTTTVEVEAITDAGRAFFARHFGPAAVGATLTKSGFMQFVEVAAAEGVRV